MEEFVCENKIYEAKNFHFLQQIFIVKTIMVESEFPCGDNLFACPQKGHPIQRLRYCQTDTYLMDIW